MNDEIIVLKTELSDIKNFVDEVWKKHKSHGRDDETIKNDIFIGKLGEYGFKKLYGNAISSINLNVLGSDPGWDFYFKLNPEIKVDIKTAKHVFYSRIYFNREYVKCSHYGLMKIIKESDKAYVLEFSGFCPAKIAVKNLIEYFSVNEHECTYIEAKFFKDYDIIKKEYEENFDDNSSGKSLEDELFAQGSILS